MNITLSPEGLPVINGCPYPSWTQEEETGAWFSPVEMPTDGKFYEWDESSLSWIRPEYSAPTE